VTYLWKFYLGVVFGNVGLTIEYFSFRIDLMRNRKGFTLIELIVVVALIMILASIGLGAYVISTIRSNDTKRRSDLSQIKAVESFNSDAGRYQYLTRGNMLCMESSR
jgi:type IV pilus assembly protein PilA